MCHETDLVHFVSVERCGSPGGVARVDDRDVGHQVAVGVGDAELRSAIDTDQALKGYRGAEFLAGLAGHCRGWILIGFYGAARQRPYTRVHMMREKYAACLVKDARADASQHDELVPDPAAQPGEVGREGHVQLTFLAAAGEPSRRVVMSWSPSRQCYPAPASSKPGSTPCRDLTLGLVQARAELRQTGFRRTA